MVERAAKREKSKTFLSVLLSLVVLAAVTPAPAEALAISTSNADLATAPTSIYAETRNRVSSNLASNSDRVSSDLSLELCIGYEQLSATEAVESLTAPGTGARRWQSSDVLGRRVYQRNDLFDPAKRSACLPRCGWRR